MFRQGMRYTYALVCGAVAVIPVSITINDNFYSIARVEGCSMHPTLNPCKNKLKNSSSKSHTASDYVLLNKWILRESDAKTGDIVVVTSPTNFRTNFIKRVIGMEGDVVRTPRYKYDHVRIPRGHCWIEGDNALESLDSNSFGPVSANSINAIATHIVWPPSRWRRLEYSIPAEREPVTYRSGFEKIGHRVRTVRPDEGILREIDCVNEIEDIDNYS